MNDILIAVTPHDSRTNVISITPDIARQIVALADVCHPLNDHARRIEALEEINRANFAQLEAMREKIRADNPAVAATFDKLLPLGGTIGGHLTPQPPAPVDAGPAVIPGSTARDVVGIWPTKREMQQTDKATPPAADGGNVGSNVGTCSQQMGADDAAVEALCDLDVTVGKDNHEVGVLNMFFKREAARAILAAIRRGEVPGVCMSWHTEAAIKLANDQDNEIAALRVELAAAKQDNERLMRDLDEWKSWRKEWIKERDEARARVAELEQLTSLDGRAMSILHGAREKADRLAKELAAMKARKVKRPKFLHPADFYTARTVEDAWINAVRTAGVELSND